MRKQEEETQESEEAQQPNAQNVQVIEREINLSLLNDKLNYLTGLVMKLAEKQGIKLD